MKPSEYILRNLCRGYIACIFGCWTGKNVNDYDKVRIAYHRVFDKYFDIKHDSTEGIELDNILHGAEARGNAQVRHKSDDVPIDIVIVCSNPEDYSPKKVEEDD